MVLTIVPIRRSAVPGRSRNWVASAQEWSSLSSSVAIPTSDVTLLAASLQPTNPSSAEAGSPREPSIFAARAKSLWLGSIGAPYRTSWAIVAISVARETWDRADAPHSPSAAGEAARRWARATNKAVAAARGCGDV